MRRDARVRLLCQQKQGVAHARNAGISRSAGEFIAPLDADDLWLTHKIACQVEAIQTAPDVGCIMTLCCGIDVEGKVIWYPRAREGYEGFALPALILENPSGCASSPLFRRRSVEEVGGYDASLAARGAQGCEDLKLLLAVAERYHVALLNEPLTGYRQVPGGMSSSRWTMLKSFDLVLNDLREHQTELPNTFFRWGRCGICVWLAAKAATERAGFDLVRFTGLAFTSDGRMAFYLLSRLALRMIGRLAMTSLLLPAVREPFADDHYSSRKLSRTGIVARLATHHRRRALQAYLASREPRLLCVSGDELSKPPVA